MRYRRERGSAPPRPGAPRNCSPAGPTSRPCRSAATSRPGWPRSERGEVDATILAAAGLVRLGISAGVPLDWLPAPGQGAIGVDIVWAREDIRRLVDAIDHRASHGRVRAERLFLQALGGDCRSAVAVSTSHLGDGIAMEAEILSPDGREVHRMEMDLYGEDMATPPDLARALLDMASPALRAMFGR